MFFKSVSFNTAIHPLPLLRRAAAPQTGTLSTQELRRIVADMVD
jgi:hypothetical protein